MRIRIREFIIALAMLATACSGCAPSLKAINTDAATKVNTSYVLHLQGQETGGSACPITPDMALTAGHVVIDYEKRADGMRGYSYSTDAGQEGVLHPIDVYAFADLGLMKPGLPFEHYYEIDHDKPFPGDAVVFIGFDWRDRNRAFRTRTWQTEIIAITASTIVMRDPGEHGSSGSCVFLAKNGKVIGINRGYLPLEDGTIVGTAVGVWGVKIVAPPSN